MQGEFIILYSKIIVKNIQQHQDSVTYTTAVNSEQSSYVVGSEGGMQGKVDSECDKL